MTIQVEIVTPSRQLFSGEVEMITMPGVEGEMGVLGGHAPLLTTLNIGEIALHRADRRGRIHRGQRRCGRGAGRTRL